MAVFETEAIILRSYDLSDADKIVVLLSADRGVIRVVAKGVKRLKSRFGGGLEPFGVIRTEYYKKDNQELGSLNHAEVIESAFAYASEPTFLTNFSYLADILLALLPPEDPNEKAFRMIRASILAARDRPDAIDAITVYCELWLLRLSGFFPDWTACVACGRAFGEIGTARVTADFHLMCEQCQRSDAGSLISVAALEMVSGSKRLGPADFRDQFFMGSKDIAVLSAVLRRILASAIGRENVDRVLLAGARG